MEEKPIERKFLGWDEMPLERAAAWLFEHFGPDMDGVLVALPGARGGRILAERLARLAGASLRPPRVVTAGLASDELLEIEGVPAGRLVRTLAWKQALAGLDPATLSRIVARAPGEDDLAGWMRLAEEVRGLFGEVAAEGLEFGHVAENELVAGFEGEQRRWEALTEAQARMVTLVEDAGFVDPHLARLRAIRAGTARPVNAVVLVGVTDMNELLRRALSMCSAPVTALVFAPADLADRFDDCGGLIPTRWSDWETSLSGEDQWFVVDGPADQADRTLRVISSWSGKYAAEEISIGLSDREIAPYLRGALAELGVTARDAAGTPMGRTRPAQLLEATARFLEGRRFADLATLVRHPDFEEALRASPAAASGEPEGSLEPVEWADAYHDAHLPWRVDGRWLDHPDDPRLASRMRRVWRAVRGALGQLLDERAHPLSAMTQHVRELLQRVYGGSDLDPGDEPDRILIASLARLGDALAEIESLPEAFAVAGRPTVALSLLLRSVASHEVPPAGARPGEPTIELLGWLELALDDAPALVVTGFEDGRVPESVRGDAFLPNRLRESLGLVDNPKRLARDLYATELLLQSREQVAFVTGRRSASGDPQVPSRIVFHCPEPQVVPRVERFVAGGTLRVPHVSAALDGARSLPRLDRDPEIETISVTAFKTFLSSPYQYYLERVVGLRSIDDRARELDGAAFGSLAHEVLSDFGNDPAASEERAEESIQGFLRDALRKRAAERFGSHPLPAVRLQLEQLDRRLARFAGVQARHRERGWKIHATEWEPKAGHVELLVDGAPIRLRGRIDRIDHHPETGQWSIWDYKTGERVGRPVTEHIRGDGEWRDLQLPLYCLLAVELLDSSEPAEIGYIALPRELAHIRFDKAESWSRSKDEFVPLGDAVDGAFEKACEVVRRIREGDFFGEEGFAPFDPIFGAIGGVGIVADEGEE